MNTPTALPLTEAQQRRLTVALSRLERHLASLRQQLRCRGADLRLTQYADRLSPGEAPALLAAIQEAEARLREMADALCLPALSESVRRSLGARLDLAAIHLAECRPSVGLRGCGEVAPVTADYLERELPCLEASVRRIAYLLTQSR